MKALTIVLSIVVLAARTAAAQSLPRWTGELTVGAGRHTTRAGTGWYFDEAEGVMRIGATYRLSGAASRAAYIKFDYVTDLHSGEKLSCAVTPTGGCYSDFRPGHGASVALGARQRILSPLVVGVAVGIGEYGAATAEDGLRPYAEGELALRVAPHVAVMASSRYLRWSKAGTAYWFAPVMVGVQLH